MTKRNPVARALRSPHLTPKVKPSAKRYKRNNKGKPTNSILDWLGGDNKPNALGYTAIDPQRWQIIRRALQTN